MSDYQPPSSDESKRREVRKSTNTGITVKNDNGDSFVFSVVNQSPAGLCCSYMGDILLKEGDTFQGTDSVRYAVRWLRKLGLRSYTFGMERLGG